MAHNKMYREIKGYEDALYLASDIVDELDELKDGLRYGVASSAALDKIVDIHRMLNDLEKHVQSSKWEGEKANE